MFEGNLIGENNIKPINANDLKLVEMVSGVLLKTLKEEFELIAKRLNEHTECITDLYSKLKKDDKISGSDECADDSTFPEMIIEKSYVLDTKEVILDEEEEKNS